MAQSAPVESETLSPLIPPPEKPHVSSNASLIIPVTISNGTPSPLEIRINARMPRPGTPGSLQFDGTNVSDFLRHWSMECDEFALSEQQKCRRIVEYCTSDLQDVVKHLQGYSTINWELLCREMKELFWHRDRNDKVALDNLIVKANARQMDLRMYVLQYAGLSERLLNCKAISPYDRFNKFLDGILSPDLRRRIFDFCASKGWSICGWTSTNDCVPEFDAVKDFVLQQADVSRMIYTYQQERKCRTYTSQPL